MFAMGGCQGAVGGKWKEPGKGQAQALLSTDLKHNGRPDDGWLAFDGDPDGLTVGPDGKVYGLGTSLAVIEEDHEARGILDSEVHGAGGLVVLSPNSFVVGNHSQLLKMQPNGARTTLAGAPGKHRKLWQPVPATAVAKDYHLSGERIEPFGTRPDGSILFSDGDVIWQLKSGHLTRVYQLPKNEAGKAIDHGSAIDQFGTVYLRSSTGGVWGRLGDVVAVSKNGSVEKLDVPERVTGVKGNLADLVLTWMAGDAGNGVYVRAREPSADAEYVLHVTPGKAEIVAKQVSSIDYGAGCKEGYLVDAMKLSCRMPEAMTYSAGSLIMAGNAPFVLKIPTR
ncbi:hypothetical protein [Streptomyces sp. NBC_01500]|uniref:hypothetical protein n=1 Tax=Streptomyces sp. NBC_01500 TaxID=2903886 RepID=UPI00224EB355|nr:hypothetical protein [Streptomyces sp. NBC_01500]MCX4549017.1 hypothetical protein [Streptomyces sp. NBC_01500]